MDKKPCSRCGAVLPLSEFYADANHSDGRVSACKPCLSATQSKKRRGLSAERRLAYNAYRRAWGKAHPESVAATTRRWREAHKEYDRERKRRWAEEHPWYHAVKDREYKRKDPERWRARERRAGKRYRQRHGDTERARCSIKSARRRAAMGGKESEAVKTFYRWAKTARYAKCYLCGKPVPKGDRHVDHVIAIDRGGRHEPSNLCVMHSRCNESKGAKPPEAVGLLF